MRYGIEAKAVEDKFYYAMRTLKEEQTASYGIEDKYDIGKYSILPNNYGQIVEVTRVPGANKFHFTRKKAGTVSLITIVI